MRIEIHVADQRTLGNDCPRPEAADQGEASSGQRRGERARIWLTDCGADAELTAAAESASAAVDRVPGQIRRRVAGVTHPIYISITRTAVDDVHSQSCVE